MANTLAGGNLPAYQINTAVGTGSAGQFLTANGINGTSWATTNTGGYQISPTVMVSSDPSSLDVKGKIIHNGRDLEERLKTIESVLQIPERDVKLEKKYPKLKKMYEDYIKELSKARMWESIKGENND
jgi:hypothetical protein